MPSDPPNLPEGRFDGDEGPAAFADVGAGYPVELGPDRRNPSADGGKPDAPLTPINTRRLHHPPPAPATDDEDEFEPARTDWRKLMPLTFTLVAAIGLGTWLALAPLGQHTTEPDEPFSYVQRTPPTRHPPTTAQPSPSPTLSATRTSASPRRTASTKPRPSPTSSAKKPSRRPSDRPVRRASSRPAVTVTETARAAPTRTARTRAPRRGGPEEPPGTLLAPTCLTWAECHDGPPR